uniref:Predicted protein n=1 Tax=Hordeum vulgare subsp. vulgare TaxID=112509 RepID=F2DY25_HORVV|nr:predicted protein [Hordeum vulgare subsp. vulgare]
MPPLLQLPLLPSLPPPPCPIPGLGRPPGRMLLTSTADSETNSAPSQALTSCLHQSSPPLDDMERTPLQSWRAFSDQVSLMSALFSSIVDASRLLLSGFVRINELLAWWHY